MKCKAPNCKQLATKLLVGTDNLGQICYEVFVCNEHAAQFHKDLAEFVASEAKRKSDHDDLWEHTNDFA